MPVPTRVRLDPPPVYTPPKTRRPKRVKFNVFYEIPMSTGDVALKKYENEGRPVVIVDEEAWDAISRALIKHIRYGKYVQETIAEVNAGAASEEDK